MSKKIQTICVDTPNAIQNNQYMKMLDRKTMVTRDKWRDFGVELYSFMVEDLQRLGFEVVLILGREGTGKSFGIKYLEPETNLWFNADRKNPTFKNIEFGGEVISARKVYGTKLKPTKYMPIPETYRDITNYIEEIKKANLLAESPVAFIIGHVETEKGVDGDVREKFKTLGSLATKMNIEGSVEYCLYSKTIVQGDKVDYKLDTINNGFNTARAAEGAFKSRYIDNNFHKVYEAIINY